MQDEIDSLRRLGHVDGARDLEAYRARGVRKLKMLLKNKVKKNEPEVKLWQ
jgi:hypothetical protein